MILDTLLDTIIDCIKILPFLFLSYLLIEFIEHKASDKIQNLLTSSGKYSKIAGSILGMIPQCGFSALASNLYSNRIITVGTLVSVFLATSDEAIPILLTYPEKTKDLILILILKLIIAILFGTIIDMIFKKKKDNNIQEHIHDTCKNCDCEHGIFKSSIYHTFNIFIFLFIISFIIGIVVNYLGEDTFENIILTGSIFQPFVASLIGLIPNCASSVLLAKLYVEGSLSIGSIVAGLSTGAGIGGIILLKTNKNMKENISILSCVYFIGVLSGIIIDLIMRLI